MKLRALLLALVGLSISSIACAQAPTRYRITDIGTLPRSSDNLASRLNGSGQVTGSAHYPVEGELHHQEPSHAYLYSDGVMRDLGVGLGFAHGHGINASGHVTGETAGRNSTETRVAFIYRGGAMEFLPAPSIGHDINASGQVVGYWAGRAFLYSDGEMRSLGSLGGGFSSAYASLS